MTALTLAAHLVALTVLPVVFVGVVNRTKALWAGRKGPPLLQVAFDLAKLLRKRSVYSGVTTEIFSAGPLLALATTMVSWMVVPVFARPGPVSLPYDFVALAYAWGLGRFAMVLAALDTGSSFEGMGASREATFAALVEPVFFLVFGSLALATGARSMDALLRVDPSTPSGVALAVAVVVALAVVLATESARIPVDDPTTHLELTMIHEVMVLDHAGPELAAAQLGAAIKLTACAAMIATVVNPARHLPIVGAVVNVGLVLLLAVVVGCVEALATRVKLRVVAQFVLAGAVAALVALLSAAWSVGGAQ